jgi:chlorite dismutase
MTKMSVHKLDELTRRNTEGMYRVYNVDSVEAMRDAQLDVLRRSVEDIKTTQRRIEAAIAAVLNGP